MLASANRRAEDIRVQAIVVAELKLGNIERQIFGADLVESADHAALKDRPETFNRVGMHRADNVCRGTSVGYEPVAGTGRCRERLVELPTKA